MNRGLIASSALHVGLFLLFLAGPSPKAFEWEPKDSIPVDLVAPAQKAPELPPARPPETKPTPEPEPKPAPVTQPEPDPVPEKVREEPPVEKQVRQDPKPVSKPKPKPPPLLRRVAPKKEDTGPSLAERLKQKMDDVSPNEDAAAAAPVAEAPPAETEPSPATSSTEVDAADFPYAWYQKLVQTRVLNAWDTPGERMIHGNVVVVKFVIHRDGRVTDIRVVQPSGTPGLDASATRAVERAQPFAPLPADWAEDTVEFTIRFRARGGDA